MRKRLCIIPLLAALAVSVWFAVAQNAPQPLETLFPSGALVYLEARDFGALLRDWDASGEKRTWLESANYEVFSRSHLMLKLSDAQMDFSQAAGVPPDYAMLSSVAGTNSALAIYDIGKLELLYVTRLPQARTLNSALWRARGNYQTRRAGSVDYYVRQDPGSQRTAAIAYTSDLLLLATREDVLAGALELIARGNRTALASEQWFTDAVAAAQPGTRELRLVYNMERLASTFQFRSHWIQRNTQELREFRSGIADLERVSGEVRERRVLLRGTAGADLSATETAAGQLLAMVPDQAAMYRAWSQPSANDALQRISETLFGTAGSVARRQNSAPGVSAEFNSGSETDLETRIDEPPIEDDRASSALIALRDRLAATPLRAMLKISSTRVNPDQVFIRPQTAFVLLADQPWDAAAVHQALTAAANSLWTHSGLGANWRAAANGAQELDGLGKLIVIADGPRLFLGDSADLVNALYARRAQPAAAGALYAAGWRHSRELPNFERMMRLIDFPELRPAPGGQAEGLEPMFYSENLASLGRTLNRVSTATITVHDPGPMLREDVVYRITP
jgi:hypothetical protein